VLKNAASECNKWRGEKSYGCHADEQTARQGEQEGTKQEQGEQERHDCAALGSETNLCPVLFQRAAPFYRAGSA
jgi:hypothetical protein